MQNTINYLLELPDRGEYPGSWDIPVNANFNKIDIILKNIATSNRSFSPPISNWKGSLWYNLNIDGLFLKKRETGDSSDFVRVLDEENYAGFIGGPFIVMDPTIPDTPANISIGSNIPTIGQVTFFSFNVTWDESNHDDFDRYIIQLISLDDFSVKEVSTTTNSYVFDNIHANTSWNVRVMEVDKQGNASLWSDSIRRDVSNDITAPAIPNGMTVQVGLSNALITWNENVIDKDIAGYEVHAKILLSPATSGDIILLGGALASPPASGDISYRKAITVGNSALISLLPNTKYAFYIRAFDRTGNYSDYSAMATGTTKSSLSQIGGNEGDIELGPVTMLGNNSYLRSGQSDFNIGQGFWLGLKTGKPKFSIGNSQGNRFIWDGDKIDIVGNIQLASGNSISSGQTAFNTGVGFWLGKDLENKTVFSLGDPNGNNITFNEGAGTLALNGALTIGNGIDYNDIKDIPLNSGEKIGIKRNHINFSTENSGEAYIHGVDQDGIPADVTAYINYGGILQPIPPTTVFTSNQNTSGYILTDLSHSNRFNVQQSPVNTVYVRKIATDQWQYDNNAGWVTFTIGNDDILIGKITTSPNVADYISECQIWQYGITPNITTDLSSTEGNEWGPGIVPPQIFSSIPRNVTGLYANDKKLGFISNGTWKSYFDNIGNLYCGDLISNPVSGKGFVWDQENGTLTIRGSLVADDMTTGSLKSTNFSEYLGSKFNLNDGTFSLGGDLVNGALTWDGDTLTTKGRILITPGSQGFNNLSDAPLDTAISSDAELFSFNINITGSRGTVPANSIYLRRNDEGKFGNCISLRSDLNQKIEYITLKEEINWDSFSLLTWVKTENLTNDNYQIIFGTWPHQYFGLTPDRKLIYSWTDGVQKSVVADNLDSIDSNWSLVGVSVDKVNSKIILFINNTKQEFQVSNLLYSTAASAISNFTLGRLSPTGQSFSTNLLYDNLVVYKTSIIDPLLVRGIYNANRPFHDNYEKIQVPPPLTISMEFVFDYTVEDYVADGYFTPLP